MRWSPIDGRPIRFNVQKDISYYEISRYFPNWSIFWLFKVCSCILINIIRVGKIFFCEKLSRLVNVHIMYLVNGREKEMVVWFGLYSIIKFYSLFTTAHRFYCTKFIVRYVLVQLYHVRSPRQV